MSGQPQYKQCPQCKAVAPISAQECLSCRHRFCTQFSSVPGAAPPPLPAPGATMPVPSASATSQSSSGRLVCGRCGKDVGFLGAVAFNKAAGRCAPCEITYRAALVRFRIAFIQTTQDGLITPQEWESLHAKLRADRIEPRDAFAFVLSDSINLIQRTVAVAGYDGVITTAEEQEIHSLIQQLAIPHNMVQRELQHMSYLKSVSLIRSGQLPRVQCSVYSGQMESDEICHLDTDATFLKVNTKSITQVPGRLVATNKKLRFLSSSQGGTEMDWKKVMRVGRDQSSGVYIEMSVKKGNGTYVVRDPFYVEAVIDTCARIAKRQVLIANLSGDPTRYIPQNVRIAVWQRDGGKCSQCQAADYLEFDHIIPVSKGGANTEGNVQLLCRRCNLAKGDRI